MPSDAQGLSRLAYRSPRPTSLALCERAHLLRLRDRSRVSVSLVDHLMRREIVGVPKRAARPRDRSLLHLLGHLSIKGRLDNQARIKEYARARPCVSPQSTPRFRLRQTSYLISPAYRKPGSASTAAQRPKLRANARSRRVFIGGTPMETQSGRACPVPLTTRGRGRGRNRR